MIDGDYLLTYIVGLAFIIALLCFGFGDHTLVDWILILCVGTSINIMAALHFGRTSKSRK